jgi:release factor glutamine methyltransferase
VSEAQISSIGRLRQATVAALRAVSDTPALDAEVLLHAVTGLPRSTLLSRPEIEVAEDQQARLLSLCARRARGEPIAYLTGTREFWSLDFAVAPEVLIPRPETEHLVERALALVPADSEWRIADLGTGCGAIAVALARERPRCRIVGTDISGAALALARANAAQLGAANVEWLNGSWLEALGALPPFDLIVSNPPYVESGDPHLQRGDVRFEPRRALDGGADGLDAIRILVARAHRCLRSGGTMLLEHGADQGDAVLALFRRHGWREIRQFADYANRPRVSGGSRSPGP